MCHVDSFRETQKHAKGEREKLREHAGLHYLLQHVASIALLALKPMTSSVT